MDFLKHNGSNALIFFFTLSGLIHSVDVYSQPAFFNSERGPDLAHLYPNKPIRLIVPSAAGSTADLLARMVAQRLSESWGFQVIVDDRVGAAGIVGSGLAAKSPPDGYTLLIVAGNHAINPSLYKNLPYDTENDFAPVTQIGSAPQLIVAHPSLPVLNIQQLITLAKKKSGQINYASAGKGTPSHLTIELFKSMALVNLTHIPYGGGGPVLSAIVSGEVQIMASGVLILMPLVKAGKLRALAVTGARRAPTAPEIPTVAESGVLGFAVNAWWGILAPAGTLKDTIDKLQREIARLLRSTDLHGRLAGDGIEALGSSPEEFRKYINQEIKTWNKVVKLSGAGVE